MIRAVLDTNIIVSALFWNGPPRAVLEAALDKQFISLTSEANTTELARVLAYPKFAEQIANQAVAIERLVGDYLTIVVPVMFAEVPHNVVRGPKDRSVLACAVGGKADFIVSGDKDLLVLTTYDDIPILSAEGFLRRLSTE